MIGDRWGVTDDEVARRYPCDELIPVPVLQAWRGVTVHSTPDGLWPWVAQIRLAPYSYDWIDNLGRRSPRSCAHCRNPQLVSTSRPRGIVPLGRILSVSTAEQLTGGIMGAVMSYVLVPNGDSTRLLLKIVMAKGRWLAPLISVGDLVMARRQLLNLKRLAEQPTAPSA